MLGIYDESELARSPYVGAIWETFVYSELRKRQPARDGGPSLYFYRDRGHEVDFLIHRGGFFELMDAKWSRSPTSREVASLNAVAGKLGNEKVLASRVLCRADMPFPIGNTRALGPTEPWFDADAR